MGDDDAIYRNREYDLEDRSQKGSGEGGKAAWFVCVLCVFSNPFAHVSSFFCHPPLASCRLFIDGDRIDAPSVKEHLLLDLGLEAEYRIQVLPYKSILSELKTLCADLSLREKVWVSDKASYAVSEAIPKVSGPTLTFLIPATPFPVLVSDSSVFGLETLGSRLWSVWMSPRAGATWRV